MTETLIQVQAAIDERTFAAVAKLLGTESGEETVLAAFEQILRTEREKSLDWMIQSSRDGVFDEMHDPEYKMKTWRGENS